MCGFAEKSISMASRFALLLGTLATAAAWAADCGEAAVIPNERSAGRDAVGRGGVGSGCSAAAVASVPRSRANLDAIEVECAEKLTSHRVPSNK